ncbi:MAG: lipopolysaccharide heptosyltransferase II, partial [Candidatus Omnitrophota bacterium]
MRILQILPELKSGGVERGTVDLAKYLRKNGHHAVVVSAGGPLVGDLTSAGVVHYTLPVHKKSPFAVIHSVSALVKIVRKENIDIMHARSRVPALIAFFASRRTQVPYLTTCHGFYSKHFLSRMMGWGKIVIVASHIIGKRMRDDFGVPYHKIRFIPRGVNLEEFKLRPAGALNPVIVGLIGRLTPIKGHPLFLKAMARVARVFPHVKVQIIGDTDKPQYREELILLARRLGLAHCVEFLGTRYDIPQLLSQMSALAAPSVGEEAFGRVVIEAGACGVPVVATQIGGLVDIIENEKEGLLVPPDDPRVLADALIRLLKDREFAGRCAANLRNKVEKEYTLDLMFEKTLEVYREALSRKRILVIKLSALGDVILSIPSLRALRRQFPNAWISVLVGRKSRKVVRNCPDVNDTIVYEEEPGKNRIANLLKTAGILAKEDFDIVVDLQNNRTSHLLAYLCGAKTRAGHTNRKWSFFLNRKTRGSSSAGVPPLEHQFRVLELVGVESYEKRLAFWTQPEEEEKVAKFLESQWVSPSQALVGINPGSSPRWTTKQWPVEYAAKLCDELARRNIRVVVTGSEEDAPLVEKLMGLTRVKPINAAGKTSITELAALIRRCQVFVSSDSAPMHIASSVNVPLIALFGPTDPKRHLAPPSSYQVFWKEIHCSPCYLRACPIGLICMKKISVQEVLDAVLHFVKEKRLGAVGSDPSGT